MIGVKCPHCGLMQLVKENCESCGRKLDTPKGSQFPRLGATLGLFVPAKEGSAQISVPQGEKGIDQRLRLFFRGTGGPLFGIFLLNALLTLVTLGIYTFWGKVRVRCYTWSQTEFEGDGFAYHGTGRELLIGFLKAMLLFGLPLGVLNSLPKFFEPEGTVGIISTLPLWGIFMLLVPVAMVGARRYRLSRTSWRGIFFSFRGQTWEFVKLFLRGSFLSFLTLGVYYPFFKTQQHGFMVCQSYFGNRKFDFDGNGRDLLKPFLQALLLTIPTLGLSWFWFMAKKERYFWEHTAFGTIHFRSTVTGRGLLALNLGNLLLLLLTLGLAWPWVMVRKIRFILAYLTLRGLLEPESIRQEAKSASATGEILAGFMDAGFDLR